MRPNFGVFLFFFFFPGAFISPICCAAMGLNYPESQARAGLDFRKAAKWRRVLSLEAAHKMQARPWDGWTDGRTPLPHCVSRNKGTSRSLKALDPCRKRFSPSLQARPRSLGAQRGLEASRGLLSGGVRSLGGG